MWARINQWPETWEVVEDGEQILGGVSTEMKNVSHWDQKEGGKDRNPESSGSRVEKIAEIVE